MYKVVKKINGRLYEYWQRTYRQGGKVKTENRYIGPVSNTRGGCITNVTNQAPASAVPSARHSETVSDAKRSDPNPGYDASTQYSQTISELHQLLGNLANMPPRPKEPQKYDPDAPPRREDYTKEEWREYLREKRELQRIYDAAMKIEKAKIRAVKRKTKGIKSLNPFLAQALIEEEQ